MPLKKYDIAERERPPLERELHAELADIYERQVDTIYRVCVSYTKTKADTEDCVSETFMKLLKSRQKFSTREHEKAWLIRVAINVCKDYLRRPVSVDYESIADTAMAEDTTEKQDVMSAVRALPEEYRAVVYLYYYEGYTLGEVAEILEISLSTVRRHMERALNLLREALTDSERSVSSYGQ